MIDEAKADAYVYGYELLISSVVSVLLVVLIAVVCVVMCGTHFHF